ncbi:MAG: 3-phosphoshikimate 1-carboxyvinyltransferase [Sandaracinaceae bacterium]|jgi:3-phosphoshikimate 1-carboxyvinyltransferase|nr:3-phosphoshikimate 1-carboxyvinyltransferase [Sandaracinaceae bacterium]MBK6808599.1 3-phosphoshikimate 1-carboxyvinyltransferase [Sandaracinaceae bacterium]MBK7150170.1 3-phosphoshikimate 1-carboxyvinyltransferase [Sandaracinaceae bacterium]MBK7774238.1 3-phosphoshikimate 1-carboxyvinyltransferase [Sandaracinaceae bacterium]MBK8410211.1 3-phosphoshikimate 1-carboxyvinyltransferase [Sandaracinaceae bacterium]
MKRYRVQKSGPLRGSVAIPGDKSIGHRAIIFGALSRGECHVTGLSGGLDNVATADCFRAMGVDIQLGDRSARIRGVGLRGLQMPKQVLDCGNSGTSMRLLAGLLAAQRFGSRMVGDHSLMRRPMGRVIEPLRARGAHIAGTSGAKPNALYPPISIAPLVEGESLSGIEYDMPIASAQVKSCMLLAGLYASGPTIIREPVLSRDHTERMMIALGVPLETVGSMCKLDPNDPSWSGGWDPFTWEVPGDPSSATFMLAAAQMVPGSRVCTTGVGVNPTRTGFFDALRFMGVAPDIESQGDGAGGEPVANLTASFAQARGTTVGGELLVRMIDEVPALAVLAATVKGRTEIRDAEELRVKESDRIAVMAKALRDFGCPCEELPDGMIIDGGGPLHAARVESQGDHRIAMSAALLGLCAEGETIVDDVECVETSFPGFPELLRSLGARIEVEVVS